MKSPLRYPGGKTRAIKILEKYAPKDKKVLISPFFGGGSFELYMMNTHKVIANDLFEPLYNFWCVLKTHPHELVESIRSKLPVNKESFQHMRKNIFTSKNHIERAAFYFCINRTSFSGSTLSGGFSKESSEKRLTESSLKKLTECIVSTVDFFNLDCCQFLKMNPQTDDTFVFADPPYYIESCIYGKDGDLHAAFNHEQFAHEIQKRNDWIITYNDCEYIRNLYKGCRIYKENWSYGMNTSKKSSEIVILPPQGL